MPLQSIGSIYLGNHALMEFNFPAVMDPQILFMQLNKVEQKQLSQSPSGISAGAVNINKSAIKVDVADIVSASACADLTLPPGAGLCIDTIHGPVFLVRISFPNADYGAYTRGILN